MFFSEITKRFLNPHRLGLLVLPLAFGYAFGLAYLSFRWFESPFLRLKKVFAPGHESIPAGTEEEPLSEVVPELTDAGRRAPLITMKA
jgi:peptidoglycan/LPS O-acetylase OafA/YrhL